MANVTSEPRLDVQSSCSSVRLANVGLLCASLRFGKGSYSLQLACSLPLQRDTMTPRNVGEPIGVTAPELVSLACTPGEAAVPGVPWGTFCVTSNLLR